MCIKEYVRINDRSLWKKQKQEDDRRQFKKEKKRGRKGGGTEPRNEFSSHCHMAQKETNLWEGYRKESRLCGSGQALGVPEHPWKWEVCLSAFLVKHLTSSHLSCRRTDLPSPWLLHSLCVIKKINTFFAVSGSTCERIFPTMPKKRERYVSVTYLEFHPLL